MTENNQETVQNKSQLKAAVIAACLIKLVGTALLSCFLLSIPSTVNHSPQHTEPVKKMIGPFPISLPLDQFPLQNELRINIDFWKKIFTEYTSDQVVIHDDWYLNVIYEVIDLRDPKFRPMKNRWKIVKTVRKNYKELLESMSEKLENPLDMTSEEFRVYSLFENITELPRFKKQDAKKRVRAQLGHANSFKTGFIRSGRYIETMKEIVTMYNLPEEIIYLPMIESTFNPFSVSYVGATGMWQFMKDTGKHYGLTINSMVDERRDPVRSTLAAARMLAHNYKVLKSWPLAITAYNHGLQGMVNAVRDVGSDNLADIINKYEGRNFGFASRNFYVEFLAVRDISGYYEKYYGEIEFEKPLELARIKLPDYISGETLEQYCKIKLSEIRELNPGFHKSVFQPGGFIPKDYHINVLPEHKDMLAAGYEKIPDTLKYKYIPAKLKHKIRKKQTLSEIASIYNTSVKKLLRFNSLKNPRKIRPGQMLEIPGQFSSLAGKPAKPVKKSKSKTKVKHRVRKGETLSEIARMYNSSVKEFKRVNSISNAQKIRAGQMLRIPEG
ncbi:MAG: LysM peptidoglycan-binding domain-containing protein [Desulfobacterales bacterium]|nr:LysM peptidoglycan-binding domain-containing protein [Desulfobacterales bacterium]